MNLIEETGHFHITNTTFDFDLCSLDRSTVRKLQSYLETSGLSWGSEQLAAGSLSPHKLFDFSWNKTPTLDAMRKAPLWLGPVAACLAYWLDWTLWMKRRSCYRNQSQVWWGWALSIRRSPWKPWKLDLLEKEKEKKWGLATLLLLMNVHIVTMYVSWFVVHCDKCMVNIALQHCKSYLLNLICRCACVCVRACVCVCVYEMEKKKQKTKTAEWDFVEALHNRHIFESVWQLIITTTLNMSLTWTEDECHTESFQWEQNAATARMKGTWKDSDYGP